MSNPNRKRNRTVSFRMNDEEYNAFRKRVIESGVSQQRFIEISRTFEDYVRQVRGMATNINQMAHVANGKGMIPQETELKKLAATVEGIGKESEKIWRSIRLSISRQ